MECNFEVWRGDRYARHGRMPERYFEEDTGAMLFPFEWSWDGAYYSMHLMDCTMFGSKAELRWGENIIIVNVGRHSL